MGIFKNTRLAGLFGDHDWIDPLDAPEPEKSIRDPIAPRSAGPPMSIGVPTGIDYVAAESATPQTTHGNDSLLLMAWLGSGVMSVIIPLIQRTAKMNRNNNNNNNNYNNNYNNGGGSYDYDVNGCKWYQFGCESVYVNNRGDYRDDQGWTPGWYSGWAYSDREKERAAEMGQALGALKFVYWWQLILFAGILYYGSKTIAQRKPLGGLVGTLFIWANLSFLSMWMLSAGAIDTDNRGAGFYGQFAVLMFMTDFWYMLFGIGFTILLGVRKMEQDAYYEDVARSQQATKEVTSSYVPASETEMVTPGSPSSTDPPTQVQV